MGFIKSGGGITGKGLLGAGNGHVNNGHGNVGGKGNGGGGNTGGSGVLNPFTTNLWGAFGLQKLINSYSGKAIRVRRSSDDTEQDFGFIQTAFDSAALLTFVGANNGFVTTWYDQTGQSHDLLQTTTTSQPQIVSSGVYLEELVFDGTDDSLSTTATSNAVSGVTMFFGGRWRNPDNTLAHALFDHATYAVAINGIKDTLQGDYYGIQGVLNSAENRTDDACTYDNTTWACRVDLTQSTLATKISIWENGVQQPSLSTSGSTTGTTVTAGTWTLGANSSLTTFTKCAVRTCMIYEEAKIDADMLSISLAIKPGVFTNVLDSFTSNLWSVCSLRKHLSSYAGSSIRVRRSSDDTEKDIGFIDGKLDISALMAFAGAGSVYVTKFYDQSGLGNDFIQATATKQPRIVNSGVLDFYGMVLDGTDDFMSSANASGTPSALTMFVKGTFTTSGADNVVLELGPDSGSVTGVYYEANGAGQWAVGVSTQPGTNLVINAFKTFLAGQVLTGVVNRAAGTNAAKCKLYSGGSALTATVNLFNTSPTGNFTSQTWYLGGRGGANRFMTGDIHTIVIYQSEVTAADIETISRKLG